MQIRQQPEDKQPQTPSPAPPPPAPPSSSSLLSSLSCYNGTKTATALLSKCSANVNKKISSSSSSIFTTSIINSTTGYGTGSSTDTGTPSISCYHKQTRKLFLLFIVVFIATLASSFDVTNCAQIPTRFFYDAANAADGVAGDDGGSADGAFMSSKQILEGGQGQEGEGVDGALDNSNKVKYQSHLQKQQLHHDVDYTDESSNTNFHLLQNDMNTDAMPMDFYRELNNITDLNEFIEHFVEKETIDPQLGLQENFSRSVERAAAVIPKRANCIPENTIVPLIPLDSTYDPNAIYFPECTRVKRCGGCCGSNLISCQPLETETINFQVTKYIRHNSPGSTQSSVGQLRPSGKEIIVIEQHTKCICDCRIKANDCNSYQLYRKDLCRCECKNHDARDKCLNQDLKIWEEASCRCVCRENQSCTTGTVFDESQCQCVDPRVGGSSSSSFSEANLNDRKRFIIKAVPVEEDNSTIYSFT